MEIADSSLAGIITAVGLFISSVTGLFLALAKFLPEVRRTRRASEATKIVAESTHKIVNQDKTDRDNFNRALIRALEVAGIPVPIDQSLRDPHPPNVI